MASNDYQFVSHWVIEDEINDVYDVLTDVDRYPLWWPEVYLSVQQIEPGDANGVGKSARLLTKGKLPYRLRWEMRVIEAHRPQQFTIQASGDFVGRGIWTLQQAADRVQMRFDWRLRAQKPLIRYLSFLFKPVFRANHFWAMARGQEGLSRYMCSKKK
jgi:hypothetical protein